MNLNGGPFFRATFVPTTSQIVRVGISYATFSIVINCALTFLMDKIDYYHDRVQRSNVKSCVVILQAKLRFWGSNLGFNANNNDT